MTNRLGSIAVALGTVSMLGCNGDRSSAGSAYDGTYMITSHTRNETGCEGPGAPVVDGPTYFQLEEETFLGQPILGWHDCETPDTCEDSISLAGSFVTIDGEWRMRTTFSSGGTECQVGMTDGTIGSTGEGIHIEIRRYSGMVPVATEDDCQPEVAEENMDMLTCDGLEVIDATEI